MIAIARTLLGLGASNWKALLAVFAFTCAVSLSVGAYQMGKQGERLETVVELNRSLSSDLKRAEIARNAEQANAIEAQAKLDLIASSSTEANKRLRELERSHAEVKEFIALSTPAAMRGLLTGKNPSAASEIHRDKR